MNHYEEIFCYYGLREHSKRTQKSTLGTRPRRNKKRLIGCEECGKGFRYEKCLAKHREIMHSLKPMRSDLLCIFGSGVQRRKRSKRVSRYKKIPRYSVSSSSASFTNFSVSEDDGDLLEVAESLIMLSKSGEALVSNHRECEQKLVGESTDGSLSNDHKPDGTSKELLGFLGDKKAMKEDESGQVKRVRGAGSFREDRPGMMLQNAETDIKQKLDRHETAFGDLNSGNEGFHMKTEHRCKLCDRVFSTYQALGGHQTSHREKKKSKHEIQSRVISRS